MSNLRTTLDHLASVFASSVLDAIRGASLQEILAESAGSAGGGRRGGRSRLEASVVSDGGHGGVHTGAPSSPAGARRRRGRLARRSAGDISQIVDSIVSLLERRPDGLRAEQIRAELGLEAKELPRPIAEALAGKRINKQGQKRATTYFARGASPRAAGGASAGTGRGRAKKSAGGAASSATANAKKTRGAGKRAGKTATAKKAGRKGGRGSSEGSASSSAESA